VVEAAAVVPKVVSAFADIAAPCRQQIRLLLAWQSPGIRAPIWSGGAVVVAKPSADEYWVIWKVIIFINVWPNN